MIYIYLALCFLYPSFAIELKSIDSNAGIATKNADTMNCEFSAKTIENKSLPLKSEFMKATDLSVKHEDGTQGIYVGVFDFLGFNFYLDAKKKLHIITETEEVEKKHQKQFLRLPATVKTNAEFSTVHNNSPVNLKEVTVVCKP